MHYCSYPDYLRNLLGERVQKLSINAGFTCPNRDGTSGVGGCSFCNGLAFNPAYCNNKTSITQQIDDGIAFHKNRSHKNNSNTKYLAYFQTFSNTYQHIDNLKKIYSEALSHPDIIGIIIATRPDCIDNEKLDYLQQLSESFFVKIEYGIESTYNSTLQKINRGHDFETTATAFEETAKRNIHSGGHLIFGLPGETPEMMTDEAKVISALPIESIKLHQLQIMRGTRLADEYKSNPDIVHLFSLDEYIDTVTKFIEQLRPDIAIERIASEVPQRFLAVPSQWGFIKYDTVLQKFEKHLADTGSFQGKNFN